jgi:hypothetical protein
LLKGNEEKHGQYYPPQVNTGNEILKRSIRISSKGKKEFSNLHMNKEKFKGMCLDHRIFLEKLKQVAF